MSKHEKKKEKKEKEKKEKNKKKIFNFHLKMANMLKLEAKFHKAEPKRGVALWP